MDVDDISAEEFTTISARSVFGEAFSKDEASLSLDDADFFMSHLSELDGNERLALFHGFVLMENSSDEFDWYDMDAFDLNFSSLSRGDSEHMLTASVVLCDVLGALCILLNAFIIATLVRHHKRVLTNVFYVIVLHCAIVDLVRGCCLIAWGMPHLLMNNMPTMHDRLLALKINQFTLVILRSCNLLTIFNLLVFTTNEFIVIRYPLHYRRYLRRRSVLILLLFSWVVSLTFGVGSVFSNFFDSAHSLMVVNNATTNSFRNRTEEKVTRRPTVLSVNMLSMLMIFILCYLCLTVVLICYGFILRTIRQFHSVDDKGLFRSHVSGHRISCTHRAKLAKESEKKNGDRRESAVIVNGDPNSPNCPIHQRRCNSHHRWHMHLMSRHKYLIVIGTVLFVDILFLFPYSGIQMVAFLHLNNLLTTSHRSTLIRWGLQILIGVHSVCQPLCYFRMNEFRRLACCGKPMPRNRSRSFSQLHKSFGVIKEGRKEAEEEEGAMARLWAESPQPVDPLIPSDGEDERPNNNVLMKKTAKELVQRSGSLSLNAQLYNNAEVALRKMSS